MSHLIFFPASVFLVIINNCWQEYFTFLFKLQNLKLIKIQLTTERSENFDFLFLCVNSVGPMFHPRGMGMRGMRSGRPFGPRGPQFEGESFHRSLYDEADRPPMRGGAPGGPPGSQDNPWEDSSEPPPRDNHKGKDRNSDRNNRSKKSRWGNASPQNMDEGSEGEQQKVEFDGPPGTEEMKHNDIWPEMQAQPPSENWDESVPSPPPPQPQGNRESKDWEEPETENWDERKEDAPQSRGPEVQENNEPRVEEMTRDLIENVRPVEEIHEQEKCAPFVPPAAVSIQQEVQSSESSVMETSAPESSEQEPEL